MSSGAPEETSPSSRIAAANLQIDHTSAQVLASLESAGVECLLLKGPAVARWLYPRGVRGYLDSDILVDPAGAATAATVLEDLGFAPLYDAAAMPEWWEQHAMAWCGPRDQVVDLHHTVPGVGVDDRELWRVLSAEREPLLVGGREAPVLSIPGRALHVALHAAQHSRADRDLEHALDQADAATWQAASALAKRLRAEEAFATGLLMLPAGRELAARLGLQAPRSFDARLREPGMPAEALTIDLFARAPDLRTRVGIVGHKLFPAPTYMRLWSSRARRGTLGLVASYGERAVWLVARAPGALRAWLAAKRATN